MTPGEQIRKEREALNLTAAQLAERVFTTANTVLRWERGEVALSFKKLEMLAKALELRVVVTLERIE